VDGDDTDFQGLMQRLRAGDTEAYTRLLDSYGDAIRLAVRRRLHDRLRQQYDSLDFVQDVWTSFLTLPLERYTFDSPAALIAFLVRVAQLKVTERTQERFTTQRRDITRELPMELLREGGNEIPDRRPTPSQFAVAEERLENLSRRLPEGHRAVLERLREGYTHEEIAAALGISVRSVDRVVRRLKDLSGM
jgi:RNA polymerase sigma-70 factor (ECF subfamily)